jgi:hypothetical protein
MSSFMFLNFWLVWWCNVLGIWFSSFVVIDGVEGLELQDVGVVEREIDEHYEHLLICVFVIFV